MEAPWVKTSIFKCDWLHASDQGICSDFIGNEFFHLAENHMPGDTKQDRYDALFQQIQEFYEDEDVADRLDLLKETFIEGGRGYKLRTSAAKCRKLVPFAWRLARELCDRNDPVEDAIYMGAYHLNEVYGALSSSCPDAANMLKEHGTKFALHYVALHDHLNPDNSKAFRLKPKLHLFLHLCIDGGDPAKHWCYRDEDFGGSVAKAARRRGGLRKPGATSARVLSCMAMGNPRVSIR
jgi:hypothetical protein